MFVIEPLADLEWRAGPPDTDREAWLAARREGVTATEVAKLAKNGPAFRRDLLAEKRGLKHSTFTGNRYTEWGKAREPVIMRQAEAHGIAAESRVFHAEDHSQFLASPDGVGVDLDGLVVAECKTSTRNLNPQSEAFAATTYYDQMQWVMRVTGARKCLYLWEQHDDVWWVTEDGSQPTPYMVQTAWIPRDEERIAELERIALGFLADLNEAPAVDPHLHALASWFLDAKERVKAAEAVAATVENDLREYLAEKNVEAADLGDFTVSFKTPRPAVRFDREAFDRDHAGVYESYMREGKPGKPRLLVNRVEKGTDDE